MAQPVPPTRTTIVRETLPSGDPQMNLEESFYKRPFWEVIHSLTTQQWTDHLVRVYRADDRWENAAAPQGNKFETDFSEDTISERWGGGRYRLWLYGSPKKQKLVMQPHNIELEGAPRVSSGTVVQSAQGQPAPAPSGGGLEPLIMQLLARIDKLESMGPGMLMQSVQQSNEIMATAFKSAAATIRETGPVPQGGGPSLFGPDVINQLITAAITKLLNPGDPLESIKMMGTLAVSMAGAVKEVTASFGGMAGGAQGKTDMMATLMNNAPALIEKVVDGLREQRLSAEANLRTMQLQSGRVIDQHIPADQQPPAPSAAPPGATSPQNAAAPAGARTAAPPQPTAAPQATGENVVLNWWMDQIADRVANTDMTGEAMYEWLSENVSPLVDQLKSKTKDELLAIFGQVPQLAPVAKNPRLTKMIDEFLAAAKKGAAN